MNFREIDERLTALVDEDGEILDVEAFESLQMEREKKAENMALWAIQERANADALDAEIKRLTALKRAAERRAEGLKNYLGVVLGWEKFKTPLVAVSYRSSRAVEVTDEAALVHWAQTAPGREDCIRYKTPEVNKSEVKALIERGVEVPGAEIVARMSVQVK